MESPLSVSLSLSYSIVSRSLLCIMIDHSIYLSPSVCLCLCLSLVQVPVSFVSVSPRCVQLLRCTCCRTRTAQPNQPTTNHLTNQPTNPALPPSKYSTASTNTSSRVALQLLMQQQPLSWWSLFRCLAVIAATHCINSRAPPDSSRSPCHSP